MLRIPPPRQGTLKALERLKPRHPLLFWGILPAAVCLAILSMGAASLLLLAGKLGWWLADTWGADPGEFL